ncbi:galactosyl transferase GMA12/MNN10 family-domain-containing protein [Protomyces lactucae-debilis]|uniref:Galactosyl transferase GMA12/MNN10 family-domain-containing protein n=1 Tax=Protomyces lactucae-debilis TaxID=2754530 RepID=A0A1Y2FM18_PROLT|nr:galactosyl transferase GMA12/MNN10 family-domain-containing protein [Protomyces lactucae-debilis]ORY84969.1 galactosyl transferase GMA12/MNN10 family-domain-containing protein [Protomyces lactucae-debilis]
MGYSVRRHCRLAVFAVSVLCLLGAPIYVAYYYLYGSAFSSLSLARINAFAALSAGDVLLSDLLRRPLTMQASIDEIGILEKSRQSVALVTASNHDFAWQGAEAAFYDTIKEREAYAMVHGYSFDVVDLRNFTQDAIDATWPVVWLKIAVLRDTFQKHPDADWVWWLDADAILMGMQDLDTYLFDRLEALQDEARRVQSLNKHPEDRMGVFEYTQRLSLAETNLIVTPDMNTRMINAGSFLLRRSAWTEMLLELWTDPYLFAAAKDDTIGFQEQGVLAHLIQQHTTIARHTAVVPMTSINAFPWAGPWTWHHGSLVMHTAGCWVHHQCEHWMKEYRAVKEGLKEQVEPPAEQSEA